MYVVDKQSKACDKDRRICASNKEGSSVRQGHQYKFPFLHHTRIHDQKPIQHTNSLHMYQLNLWAKMVKPMVLIFQQIQI